MMLSYNSVKCVTVITVVLESISKFFRLVLNGVYIEGNVLVASLVEKMRLLLQEAKWCRRYNGPGYDKRYLMVILIKYLYHVASAKYDYLSAFLENLKHFFQYWRIYGGWKQQM